jgi:hypothetical protein
MSAGHDDGVPGAAFYCVADARYFLGAVGLVNSLRLVGHAEPVFLLDCGLEPSQRALLEPEVTVVEAPADTPPWLLKTVLPLRRPADAMALLDTDIVVTRGLGALFERARSGGLVAFRNPEDRFVPEWGDLLGLGSAKRGDYVSSAALLAKRSVGEEVLGLLAEHQRAVDFDRTYWRGGPPDYPFRFGDQDVLNAILASGGWAGRLDALDARLAATPPFAGLRVADEPSLRCSYADGTQPFLVHHHVTKPWLEPTHHGVYSQLLRRLLIGDDVAIRVPEQWLPQRFRRGARAYLARARINVAQQVRFRLGRA